MERIDKIPAFAIIGHPNEGKSSVVSTLAEDDRVRISAFPGETVICESFPVKIDGVEMIRFIDTPGFQNPKRTLQWFKKNHVGMKDKLTRAFVDQHSTDPDMEQDCELLTPVAQGAGIIYVVDGSRPLRGVDEMEMEILRLTGAPRMAIINLKEEDSRYLSEWKSAFRLHFNAIRVFNAHQATYAERIDLLENLKSIDQDWADPVSAVISAFKKDWANRTRRSVEIILEMLLESLEFSTTRNLKEKTEEEEQKKTLFKKYKKSIEKIETSSHQQIRKLYKHNIFNYYLPEHSIMHQDLFSEKTWQVLGLSRNQLTSLAAITGGTLGAALDIAAAGLSFGIFTLIGGVVGAGWAALGGGRQLSGSKLGGIKLGGQQIQVGPNENVQFLYILLDRAFIFYSHIINWAHGRRDLPETDEGHFLPEKSSFTASWSVKDQRKCIAFFKAVQSGDRIKSEKARKELGELIRSELIKMYSGAEE